MIGCGHSCWSMASPTPARFREASHKTVSPQAKLRVRLTPNTVQLAEPTADGLHCKPRRRSSVGESARLIIERSAVRVCPPLHRRSTTRSLVGRIRKKEGTPGDG